MNIIVTGAAGFIGSHVSERLISLGHNVIGVDNFSNYYDRTLKQLNANILSKKGVSVLALDLRYEDLSVLFKEPIAYIFHFAAHPGISKTSTFDDYHTNNIIGTRKLIEAVCKYSPSTLFVNISTSSVYGLKASYSEEHIPKPVSWYGVTKLAAEQLVLSKQRLGLLKATSLRLFSVYGPRERPDKLYTRLIDCAINNKPFTLYKGSENHIRSYTYVQDIVDGVVSVMGKKALCDGEIFNIGSESQTTTKDGIKAVEKLLNTEIKIITQPPRSGDQLKNYAVITKAKKILAYYPNTTLEEGLKAQIEWFEKLPKS